MRILHTSDWHLGRAFHRVGMLGAQAAFVDHLVEVVRGESVDVVVVSGDIYDRAMPSVDVVGLLDEALTRLVGTGAHVVLVAGNHDSARRLAFGARLLESARVHIRADVDRLADPVLLDDAHGPVAIYPLPYLEPTLVSAALGCAPTHGGVLGAALDLVRSDLARRRGTRSVVAAHAFVVGGQVSDSERDIAVGGVAAVPAAAFDGVDYVALGHLHRRQQLSAGLHYSGSPLAYSFSEHAQVKVSLMVELAADGAVRVEPVPAPVPRPLAVLEGSLDELLWRADLGEHEQAWCQVTLTDAQRPARAMERLRSRFEHTLELRWQPREGAVGENRSYGHRLGGRADLDICCDFLTHVRGREASATERGWLQQAVEARRLDELEATGVAALRDRQRRAERAAAAPSLRAGLAANPGNGSDTGLDARLDTGLEDVG